MADQDFRTSGYTDSFCNKTLDFVPLFMQRTVLIKFFCFVTLFLECTMLALHQFV